MPTIDDVARACGVSKATVSKALDTRPGRKEISAETCARIAAAASEMGYEPAWRLRQRARRRTRNIALVYAAKAPVTDGAYSGFAERVAERLADDDLRLVFVPLFGDPLMWHKHITDQRFDGCLVIDPAPRHLDRLLAITGVPAVLINQVSSLGIPQMRADERAAIGFLIDHMVSLGHRRLGYVMRPRQGHGSEVERAAAFTELAPPGSSMWIDRIENLPAKWQALPADQAPTAFIAYNADDGLHLHNVLSSAGIAMPGQLSLACCDDIIHAEYLQPSMTVVTTPLAAMGVRAVAILEDLIEGRRQPGPAVERVAGHVIARGSTGPCPR